jgi:Protein of unknown function (DUF2798)
MTSASPGQPRATGRRLDPKYAPLLIPAIMAIAMSFVMSLVQTVARLGFTPDWPQPGSPHSPSPYDAHDVAAELSLFAVHNYAAHDARVGVD